ERTKPDLLNASRKRRVAAGSGTRVEDINRLLKQHRQMADMMKAMGKKKGGMLGGLFGGGMPDIDPAALEEMAKTGQVPTPPAGGLPPLPPGGLGGGLPPMPRGGLPGLPGLGGKSFPGAGLPGGFGRKK
ncbi:hypothetical protein J8J27_22435, partial [Mycobacterium tuberculosis]|nr:hypothetical protein [Mycobacterium tuberculosis]